MRASLQKDAFAIASSLLDRVDTDNLIKMSGTVEHETAKEDKDSLERLLFEVGAILFSSGYVFEYKISWKKTKFVNDFTLTGCKQLIPEIPNDTNTS